MARASAANRRTWQKYAVAGKAYRKTMPNGTEHPTEHRIAQYSKSQSVTSICAKL